MNKPGTSVMVGAILTVAMRWSDRLFGLLSTLILARLLVPADFGVIAMASLVIGLADVLLDLGVHVALIQQRAPTQEHYDSAFTLRMIQCLTAAILVIACTPWAARYFNEPRVADVLPWLALSFVISACENIGLVTFQKEMRFADDFRFMFLKRMSGVAATLIAAWLLRSYWALVIGNLLGRSVGVILSYAFHPMRPRLALTKAGSIVSVSQWLLLRSMAAYLDAKLHQILVGRRENTTIMGAYALGDDISTLPTTELLAPLNRVLFPAFVKVKDNLAELKRVYLLAQGMQTLIGIPAGVGLAMVAREAVLVLLGEKWLIAVPFVEIIALTSVVHAITTSGGYLLITLGKSRAAAIFSMIQALAFLILALTAIPTGGATAIAWLRLLVAIANLSSFAWFLGRTVAGLGIGDTVAVIYRPLLAAAAMAFSLHYLMTPPDWPPLAALLLEIGAGAGAYALSILLLWRIAGRPAGAESFVLGKIDTLRRHRSVPR